MTNLNQGKGSNVISIETFRKQKAKREENRNYDHYVSLLDLNELINETNGLLNEMNGSKMTNDQLRMGQKLVNEFISRIKFNSEQSQEVLLGLQNDLHGLMSASTVK